MWLGRPWSAEAAAVLVDSTWPRPAPEHLLAATLMALMFPLLSVLPLAAGEFEWSCGAALVFALMLPIGASIAAIELSLLRWRRRRFIDWVVDAGTLMVFLTLVPAAVLADRLGGPLAVIGVPTGLGVGRLVTLLWARHTLGP